MTKTYKVRIKDVEYAIGRITYDTIEIIRWHDRHSITVNRKPGDTAGDAGRRALMPIEEADL